RVGQVEVAAALRPLGSLARADDLHLRTVQALGDFRRGDDQRAAAVGDHAAVQTVQRVGDHRRVQHVLDGDHVTQHGVLVPLGVVAGRHLDPGQLLAGGAVLVHVARGAHGVGVVGGAAVDVLEAVLGRSVGQAAAAAETA